MNHIYRLVWNKKRRMLMAVGEIGSAQGKENAVRSGKGAATAAGACFRGLRRVMAAALVAVFPLASFATPTSTDHYIAFGSTEFLNDQSLSNAEASGWRLTNDGGLDISGTDYGTRLLSLAGYGTVSLGERTLTLTGANSAFEGGLQGWGGLTVEGGTQELSGTNSYYDYTRIADEARLVLSGSGSIALSAGLIDNGVFDIAATTHGAEVQSLYGSGAVLLGGQTLTLTYANDVFDGVIHGSGGLAIGGREILTGTNTYTGATAIGWGSELALSGSGSIALSSGLENNGYFNIAGADNGVQLQSLSGSGGVWLGGQSLTLSNASGVFAGNIDGWGGLNVNGGTEVLSGENTYAGLTVVGEQGTLVLSGSGSIALSNGVLDNGVFDISTVNNGVQVQSLSGSGSVLLGGQTLSLSNAHDEFAGSVRGSGGLAISGYEVLSGTNTYTGTTAIGSGSQLALAGSGSIALSSGVLDDGLFDISATKDGARIQSLSGSGSVLLGGQTLTLTGAGGEFAGSILGSGGLAIGAGVEVLSGANTYTGSTIIGRGAGLQLDGSASIALSSGLVDNGVFDIRASNGGARIQSLSGSGAVLLGGQTLTLTHADDEFAGAIHGSGGLTLASGNQTLSGANDYTGATVVKAAGTLSLSGSGSIALSSGLLDNGLFDIAATNGGARIQSLSGSGAVLLGGQTLTLTNARDSFGGGIHGSGGLAIAGGSAMLTGVNTYSGATSIAGGARLALGGSGSILGSAVQDDGVLDLTAAAGKVGIKSLAGSGSVLLGGQGLTLTQADGRFGGTLSGSGGVTIAGGKQALSGTNTYSGGTVVAKGATLRIDSDANLGAAGGRLTLDGGTLQTSTTMTSARAVTLTAQTGTFDTEGAASVVTLDGNIGGDGRLVKEGAGTLVLAGDNAGGQGSANKKGDGWTGGLTINDGLVKVTNAYGLGWGSVLTFNAGTIVATVDIATGQDIRMGGKASIDTEANTVTTLAGNLLSAGSGYDCFTKTGLGTLNVTGAANIASTCVMQGKLLANGTFSSKVTVAQGATLGGSGTIKGDVLVRGTLSPGNSPGMLTADSNITMATGSTYKEDIGGTVQASSASPVGAAGYYSYLNVVNGKRFVIEQGATLAPTLKDLYSPTESGYGSAPLTPQLGQTFRIVSAEGGIVGRFDTVLQPEGMAGTRMAAFYNAGGSNSIELKVLPASYATWVKDGNGNSRSAGAALDRIVDLDQSGKASARQDALLYQAGSYDAAKLGGLVRGLSGEVHGALAAAAPQAGWDLQRSVLKHGAADDGRALWLDISGSRGKWSSDDAASGFHADRVQVTVGADVYATRDSHLGFGASHAHTDLSAGDADGTLSQNKVFVYGDTTVNGLVFDAIGAYGRDKGDTSRADPFATVRTALTAAADGHSAMLGAGVRTQREFAGNTIEPFARVTVQNVERDAAREGGASLAALSVDGYSATGTRLVTGLSAASHNSDPLQASTWRLNVGAGVDTGSLLRPTLQASLAGVGMTAGAPDVGRVFVQGGASGTLQIKKGAYLYFGVSGEARSGYYQVGGNAGVRAVF